MSVELFTTNLDFLTKLQAVFNLNDFILNFNVTQINVQGGFFFSKSINMQTQIRPCRGNFFSKLINVHARLFGTLEYLNCESLYLFDNNFVTCVSITLSIPDISDLFPQLQNSPGESSCLLGIRISNFFHCFNFWSVSIQSSSMELLLLFIPFWFLWLEFFNRLIYDF